MVKGTVWCRGVIASVSTPISNGITLCHTVVVTSLCGSHLVLSFPLLSNLPFLFLFPSFIMEFGEAIKNPAYRIFQTEYSGCLDISAHA